MASEPDITLAELKKRLFSEGLEISQQAINTTLQALGCSRRVLRGGSWFYFPRGVRSASRFRYRSSDRSYFFGFRISRTHP